MRAAGRSALPIGDHGASPVLGAARLPSWNRRDGDDVTKVLLVEDPRTGEIATAYLEAFEGQKVEVRRARGLAEALDEAWPGWVARHEVSALVAVSTDVPMAS